MIKKEVNNSIAHQKILNFLVTFWGVDGPESAEGELQNIWRTKRNVNIVFFKRKSSLR